MADLDVQDDQTTAGDDAPEQQVRAGAGFWVKVIGLALFDAIVLAVIPSLIEQGATVALISIIVGTLGINFIFLSHRTYAYRWLVPGVVFLTILMVWPIIFSVYVAFTNWSTGNFLTKDQVIEQLTEGGLSLIEPDDAPTLDMLWFEVAPGEFKMLVRNPDTDELFYGSPRTVQDPIPEEIVLDDLEAAAVVDADGDGLPESIDGVEAINTFAVAQKIPDIDSFILDIPGGEARARTLSTARLAQTRFVWDETTEVMFDRLNDENCTEVDAAFSCAGDRINPGWREVIGFGNITKVATDPGFRDPFVRVFTWNVIFAVVVVAFQFILGLGLAMVFQDPKMKFKRLYRSLLIVPYAAPAFISLVIWRGMLNRSFGQLNRALEGIGSFFGLLDLEVAIPWLTDPFWAKVAVILVTVWQGVPYFFLINSGALQSIPKELTEAARVDGAAAPQVFRKVTFPLLMVSIAPLLIASFSFNFNNFLNIFLITGGGPPLTQYAVPVGETDILISFTFDLAVESGRGALYGLASALTIFIFFIVATIAAFSFRFTKRLETIYGNL
ncbi:MAG: ABC transporter permease subunit [Acidimicrobiia bacterium]|nr:ABC transporter permease subunit [Acidimicrobiia bacterium]